MARALLAGSIVALAAALPAAASAASAAPPPQALAVNFSAPLREDYGGVGAVRHGFDYMPEETTRGLTDALRGVGYDRMSSARLAAARTWYASEWAMPGGWGSALDFTTPRFTAFAAWVGDMAARNVSVTLNAGWWFTQATCGAGPPSNCTPTPASLDVYTAWVSATVRELVVARGYTNVDTLLLFTEPLTYDSG